MTDWDGTSLLGFDTETTGVNVRDDRIVTIALVLRRPQGDEVRTWLINPGVPIPAAATAVHGITDEITREYGQDPLVALPQARDLLFDAMSLGVPAVAFNASYDFSILEAELARHGLPTLASRLKDVGFPGIFPVVDPLVIDRAKDRFRKGKRRLADMREAYGLPSREDYHDAKADVEATLELLGAITANFPELLDLSLEELQDFQAKSHEAWASDMNQWMASKGRSADINPGWPLSVY